MLSFFPILFALVMALSGIFPAAVRLALSEARTVPFP